MEGALPCLDHLNHFVPLLSLCVDDNATVVGQLDDLVRSHDVCFALTDSREARYARSSYKCVVNISTPVEVDV